MRLMGPVGPMARGRRAFSSAGRGMGIEMRCAVSMGHGGRFETGRGFSLWEPD